MELDPDALMVAVIRLAFWVLVQEVSVAEQTCNVTTLATPFGPKKSPAKLPADYAAAVRAISAKAKTAPDRTANRLSSINSP